MEEFKAKRHAVKKLTRKGLVETDSREGIVKETAEAKSDGRRIDIRRYTAEVEILRLYHFRSYCYPFNGIRKTLIVFIFRVSLILSSNRFVIVKVVVFHC